MNGFTNDLPTGWISTRLGNLYNFEYGKSLTKGSRAEAGRYPVYGSSGIVGMHDQFLIEGPAIIVGRKGAAGSVSYSTDNLWPIDTTYYVQDDKCLCLKFSYYLFLSLNLAKLEASTAIPGLNRNHAYDETVLLPPLAEQHRIVTKIEELFSELDKGIENLGTARAQLKVYRQALLKHAFEGKFTAQWRAENRDKLETAAVLQKRIQLERTQRYRQQLADWEAAGKQGSKPKAPKALSLLAAEELAGLPELPAGWGWCKLGDFIISIDAGKSFKCDEREPLTSEIGVAKVSAITWGEYDESESKTCTDTSKENEAYLIQIGDFILSRANTIDLVGACVIARKVTKKIMLSDKTLRINFDGISQEYFLQYLCSRMGRNQIMQLSTGNQESMRNIGQDRIRSIAAPICSKIEAEMVVETLALRLSECDQLDQTITTSLQQAEALRQSILKKAFSGQLVPQDPHDEPASALLARIKAGKTTQSISKKVRT